MCTYITLVCDVPSFYMFFYVGKCTHISYIITQSLNGLNQTFQLIDFEAQYNACDRLLIGYTICWSWSMEHKYQSSTAFSAVQKDFSLHKMAIKLHFHIVHFWVQHICWKSIYANPLHQIGIVSIDWDTIDVLYAHCTIDQGKANQRLMICATWFPWSGH